MSSPLFPSFLFWASLAPRSAQNNDCAAAILVCLLHYLLHTNVGRETVRGARGCGTQDGVGSEGASTVSDRREEQDTDEGALRPGNPSISALKDVLESWHSNMGSKVEPSFAMARAKINNWTTKQEVEFGDGLSIGTKIKIRFHRPRALKTVLVKFWLNSVSGN
ncbi:hypothetical protein C8F04DRAFT_1318324 [Mycena alexandri]|uniref:Uncharacterized protein n=1 Tax=Mycena alexandri TaxID=1745969 RepID=A0AAD6S370_9AGAR|nr:hypothetical protein C8F04DRAFT_1318324 [Mycena alexandri]